MRAVVAALLVALVVASAASASTPRQRAWCIGDGEQTTCATGMRLSCVLGGKTTLRRIPASAFGAGSWRISIGWSGGGYQTPHGPRGVRRHRFSVSTMLGGARPRWVLATIDLPTKQVIIRTGCRR